MYMVEVSGNSDPAHSGPTFQFLWALYLSNYESHHFEEIQNIKGILSQIETYQIMEAID